MCIRDRDRAVEDFTAGIRLSPNPQGYESRGKTFERLGDRDKALSDYQAALKMAPGFKSAQESVKRLGQKSQ